MPEDMNSMTDLFLSAGSLFLLTLLLSVGVRIFLNLILRREKNFVGAKTLAQTSSRWLQWILWVSFLFVLLKPLGEEYLTLPFGLTFTQFFELFLAVAFFGLLWRWKTAYFKVLLSHEKVREKISLLELLSKLTTVLIGLLFLISLMEILHVPITAIYALSGIGGIAISFAASDVIKNLFGGIVIHINRYFTVGDWITSPNKNFQGVVLDTGWYLTTIRTKTGRPLYIPNGLLSDAMIENQAHTEHRRFDQNLSIKYDNFDRLKASLQKLRNLVETHPAVDKKKSIMVHFVEYGTSSLELSVICYTRSSTITDFRRDQEELLFQLGDLLKAQGLEFAYPTQTLYVNKEGGAS